MRAAAKIILIAMFQLQASFGQQSYYNLTSENDNLNFTLQNIHNHSFYKTELITSAKGYSALNIAGQLTAGSVLAVGFSLPFVGMAWGNAWSGGSESSQALYGVLAISSYLFGAGTGVHWIASIENKGLPFWETVGYSVLGGAAGTIMLIILASNYTTIPEVGGTIAAASPILGSMIYSCFVSDWGNEQHPFTVHHKIASHQDFINNTKLVDLNILRLSF